ncbi:MAG: hypothetical protein KGJ21_10745 [Pseudomonadota bacterium]|nr:hypothetical protein [Pseudomonadota bacterium]
MAKPSQDTIDDLIDPVLHIADLRPNNDWPPELRALIAAARKVKALYGFGSVTIKADDPRPIEEILAAHGVKL